MRPPSVNDAIGVDPDLDERRTSNCVADPIKACSGIRHGFRLFLSLSPLRLIYI
tara:strand:+ start:60 stop:221 length:162 start_codon:yes stop_codon:yes gene_type:complete